MQNNTSKSTPPVKASTGTTQKKKFRNVALQSTKLAEYSGFPPGTNVVGNPPQILQQQNQIMPSVNTQILTNQLAGVTSATSTSDFRPSGTRWANPFGRFVKSGIASPSGASKPAPAPVNQFGQLPITSSNVQPGAGIGSVVRQQTQNQPDVLVDQNRTFFRVPLQNRVTAGGGGGENDIIINASPNQLNMSTSYSYPDGRYLVEKSQGSQFQQLSLATSNPYDIFETLRLGPLALDARWGLVSQLKATYEDVPNSCPEGFEGLLDTENVFVQHADAEFVETFFHIHNKYDLLNTFGERIYLSGETLNVLSRPNCAGAQSFQLSIIGCRGGEVFRLRGKNYTARLCTQTKQIIGSIYTSFNWCDSYPNYKVTDANDQLRYQIYHEMGNKNVYDYEVYDKQMNKIGRLSKTWIGLPYPDQELPYSYGVSFPLEIDVLDKSLLMAALFVAYFQYFEDTQRERRYNRDVCCATVFCTIFFILAMIGLAFGAAYIILH